MAADAMHGGSRGTTAMIFMAFLAVLREGFETVVFLLAAFNESTSGAAAGWGAVIGIAVATGLGYAIYRGGVRLNLSKFFRATGLVLVLVAAGLVLNALHTAHEAGWLNSGQGSTLDLSGLVQPGTVQASLLTGMLGLQPHPVVIEVVGWLLYLVPVGVYVGWPPGKEPSRRTMRAVAFGVAAVSAVSALVLALLVPGRPSVPAADRLPVGPAPALRLAEVGPTDSSGVISAVPLHRAGGAARNGLVTTVYRGTAHGPGASNLPARLSTARVAALNGGRLPLGTGRIGPGGVPVTYAETVRATVWTDERTGRLIDTTYTDTIRVVARAGVGALPLARPLSRVDRATAPADVDRAVAAARADRDTLDRRNLFGTLDWWCVALALVALAAALALLVRDRLREPEPAGTPERQLVKS
jgi:high-affinity iron transporter